MKRKNTAPKSGADLRAMRDQRQGVSEAHRREASFLRNIAGAGDDLEWILVNQAWTQLGFERIGDWWETRVLPVLTNLDVRPSQRLADAVIAAIRSDEAGLPRVQRRTQREIATLARFSQTKVSRSLPDAKDSGSDLGGATPVDDQPAGVEGAERPTTSGSDPLPVPAPSGVAESGAGDSGGHDAAVPTTTASPVEHDGPTGEGAGTAADTSAPAGPGFPQESDTSAPGGESQVATLPGQPGHQRPATPDVAAEDPSIHASGSSAVDTQTPGERPDDADRRVRAVVAEVEQLADWIEALDVDALGPLFLPAELDRLDIAAGRIGARIGQLWNRRRVGAA